MVRCQPFTFLLRDHCGFGDAKQCIMRVIEITIRKIGVVGRDERQIVSVGQFDKAWLGACLIRRPVAHQLDIKPVRKETRQPSQNGLSGFSLALPQKPTNRASWSAGQAKEPLVGFAEI